MKSSRLSKERDLDKHIQLANVTIFGLLLFGIVVFLLIPFILLNTALSWISGY